MVNQGVCECGSMTSLSRHSFGPLFIFIVYTHGQWGVHPDG